MKQIRRRIIIRVAYHLNRSELVVGLMEIKTMKKTMRRKTEQTKE
jgi:hypothetical protein